MIYACIVMPMSAMNVNTMKYCRFSLMIYACILYCSAYVCHERKHNEILQVFSHDIRMYFSAYVCHERKHNEILQVFSCDIRMYCSAYVCHERKHNEILQVFSHDIRMYCSAYVCHERKHNETLPDRPQLHNAGAFFTIPKMQLYYLVMVLLLDICSLIS